MELIFCIHTFLENIFCNEKPIVDIRAANKPIKSKDISVMVAIPTPNIIGIKLRYTRFGCFSPNSKRVNVTVNNGIVALTAIIMELAIRNL